MEELKEIKKINESIVQTVGSRKLKNNIQTIFSRELLKFCKQIGIKAEGGSRYDNGIRVAFTEGFRKALKHVQIQEVQSESTESNSN